MTGRIPLHTGRIILLILGIFAFFLAVGYIAGCSSDKEKAKEAEEESGLPADYGEKALLDTTTTVAEKPAEKPAQKPATTEQKPAQRPVVKEEPKAVAPPKPQIVKTTILPANTALHIALLNQVSTGESKIGDKVRAIIKGPAGPGESLPIPEGSMLEGVVADLNDGKAEGAKAYIKLRFTSLILPGEGPIPMEGYIVTKDGSGVIHPGEQGTSIARDAGIGAVAGGVIGGVTGGKTKDAVKGAAVGAVAGGVLGAVLHKDQVTLKEGREFDVTLVTPAVKETTK